MTLEFHAPMSESSQRRPVIFWISMPPGTTDRSDQPVDATPSSSPCHHDVPPTSAEPTIRSGVFIPYSALQILAVLVGGGLAGLFTLQWPQAAAALGTICAIIGAGLAILDIMRRQNGKRKSGSNRA
jgi:hypothetical protein